MSDTDQTEYDYLYNRSKRLYGQDRFNECLDSLKKAYELIPSAKLQDKINKLENYIENQKSKNKKVTFVKNENKIYLNEKYYVNEAQYNKLYSHQKVGVMWLFDLFTKRKGGILGDDMGLGKTIQMIFVIRELFESNLLKKVLIVIPKSLLINWEREFKIWGQDIRVLCYFGADKERNFRKIQSVGGILITTYNSVVYNWEQLNESGQNKFDMIILDEGHKIKNTSTKTFKAVNAIRSDIRFILTGTAVQNNLKELWSLFEFIHQGSLLGEHKTFYAMFEKPITDSRKKDASNNCKEYGNRIAQSLKEIISPYMLRRTKEEVNANIGDEDLKNNFPKLSRKNELVVWVPLSKAQINCYKKFLESGEVKALICRSEVRSPLMELNILKKICDHPRLLRPEYYNEMGLDYSENIELVELETLLKESGKIRLLIQLLDNLIENKHKCLIFSQSKVILNIVQKVLKHKKIPLQRLDGDVQKTLDRQEIIDNFNNNPVYRVMLLTSQVGGVGLTLTAADRVVIYDLSWNPANDAQAVDRVYRIGQRKDVVVYRLVTCGTVEEKVYRRQIFKDSLNRQTTGKKAVDENPYRYFTNSELLELFKLGDLETSETQKQLQEMHLNSRNSYTYLDEHIEWLTTKTGIFGVSDHDRMFSEADAQIQLDEEAKKQMDEQIVLTKKRLVSDIVDNKNLWNDDKSVKEINRKLGSLVLTDVGNSGLDMIPLGKNIKTGFQLNQPGSKQTNLFQHNFRRNREETDSHNANEEIVKKKANIEDNQEEISGDNVEDNSNVDAVEYYVNSSDEEEQIYNLEVDGDDEIASSLSSEPGEESLIIQDEDIQKGDKDNNAVMEPRIVIPDDSEVLVISDSDEENIVSVSSNDTYKENQEPQQKTRENNMKTNSFNMSSDKENQEPQQNILEYNMKTSSFNESQKSNRLSKQDSTDDLVREAVDYKLDKVNDDDDDDDFDSEEDVFDESDLE